MRVTLSLALLLIAGCASAPREPVPATPEEARDVARGVARGVEIAAIARHLIGTPYEFGGADSQGFDCSGLALFAYERVGLEIPRTAADQGRTAKPVAKEDLAPGDLVFFRMGSHHINHVGIYTGAGGFVHAPRRGETVSSASLADPYFRKRFAGAGRFE